jgi:hypothetical protein
MIRRKWSLSLLVALGGVVAITAAAWIISRQGPAAEKTAYNETFDATGTWIVGNDPTAQGQVRNGVYEMYVQLSGDSYWVTGGRTFADATYELEATPIEGTMDNGYGMLFRVDSKAGNFYLFKVSSDGYVYIGLCQNNCAQSTALVDRDWFASPAVKQGHDQTNHLRVLADGPQMTFFVNGAEVGQANDNTLHKGDIGLVVETFTPGGLRVTFDNFNVTPLK